MDRPEKTIEESLEELLEVKGFLSRTSWLLEETCPFWMSIPISFSVDIVGKEELVLDAVVEILKLLGEKDNGKRGFKKHWRLSWQVDEWVYYWGVKVVSMIVICDVILNSNSNSPKKKINKNKNKNEKENKIKWSPIFATLI